MYNNNQRSLAANKEHMTTPQRAKNGRRARGKVIINEGRNTSHPARQTKEEAANTWLTASEHHKIKTTNADFVKTLLKGGRTPSLWRHCLERAYATLNEETLESLEDLGFDFETSLLSDIERYHLASAYTNDRFTLLGLERLLAPTISEEKHLRRQGQLDITITIEETYRFPNSNVQAHFISVANQALSLTSRLFARETAMALAASLNQTLAPPKRPQAEATSAPELDESSCSSAEDSFETARESETDY